MSDELKPCPFCGKSLYYEETPMGIDAHCTSKGCVLYGKKFLWLKTQAWNTRPIEDALQVEIERLSGIILNASNVTFDWKGEECRECCDSRPGEEHEEDCSFYKWEGGNHD